MAINNKNNKNTGGSWILPKRQINKNFKDHQERFRFFNRLFHQPGWFSFIFISLASLILSIIPLVIPSSKFTLSSWLMWGAGLFISIFFEQISNLHYMRYSKVANSRNFDSVRFNVYIVQGLKFTAFLGWICSGFAVAMMVVGNGSFSSIW